MKKLAIAFLFLLISGGMLHAQDMKKARNAVTLAMLQPAKLEEAKTEVDKLFTDDKTKNDPESYLLKMEVYADIAGDETLAAKYPDAITEGYAALNKYIELEPSEEKLKAAKFQGINELYNGLFKAGVKYYQAEDWSNAFAKFKVMAAMGDMLIARKWSNASFDTTAYLYAAATAQNSKQDAEAVKYYSKLADIKVKGKDYESVYEYLTKYYLNNPNDEQFKKYIALAKEVYPENTLWKDIEFEYNKKNANIADFVKKFDAADAANSLSSEDYSEYGNFFVSDDRIRDMSDAEKAPYTAKAMYAFSKAYEKDTTNGVAAYNAGVTAYQRFETVADSARAIKGTTADIKTQKTAANKQASEAADNAINWLEKAHRSLLGKTDRSNLERGLLNKSVDLLYNVYEYKRDMSRGVNPKDYDAYDAKLTYYNGLHNKY